MIARRDVLKDVLLDGRALIDELLRQQTYVAQVDFVLREHVPNEFVRVNPLGLQVEYFRVDQAFEDGRR